MCVYPPCGIHGSVNFTFVADWARAAGMEAASAAVVAAVPAGKLRRVMVMWSSSARASGEAAARPFRGNVPVHYQALETGHDAVQEQPHEAQRHDGRQHQR